MKQVIAKLKPKHGFSYFLHLGLTILLPILIYIFVRIDLKQLALAIILLGKWRMFAVRPRHWPANIRANAIDILVGVSLLVFIAYTDSMTWQIAWSLTYAIWLIFIKPMSSVFGISLQAMVGQLIGLMALFLEFDHSSLLLLVLGSWGITYAAARHFLASFDEPLTRLLSYFWAYFAAAGVWGLGHWLLFYPKNGPLAQPTLLLTVVGYGLGTLYYLHETDRLSKLARRQIVLVMIAVVFVVLAFSDWGDKAI